MRIKAKIGEGYRYYSGRRIERQVEDPGSYKEVLKKEFFGTVLENLAK